MCPLQASYHLRQSQELLSEVQGTMIKGAMSRYLLPFQKAKTFIASIVYLK